MHENDITKNEHHIHSFALNAFRGSLLRLKGEIGRALVAEAQADQAYQGLGALGVFDDIEHVAQQTASSCSYGAGLDGEGAETFAHAYATGVLHGVRGWYPEGDYSSDADWVYGIGDLIMRQEDDTIFDVYQAGHAAGLATLADIKEGVE
jgi:hypothetical protein